MWQDLAPWHDCTRYGLRVGVFGRWEQSVRLCFEDGGIRCRDNHVSCTWVAAPLGH